jgi:nucleoid DNA-binding protein
MKEQPTIASITRQQLVRAISQLICAPKAAVEDVLTELSVVVANELCAGRQVRLPGIGRLVPRRRRECVMSHPRTGEPLHVPARTVIVLRLQPKLLDSLEFADRTFD